MLLAAWFFGITWFVALFLSLIYQPQKWIDKSKSFERSETPPTENKALFRGLFCAQNCFPYAIWLLTHSASLDFVMAPEWVATA